MRTLLDSISIDGNTLTQIDIIAGLRNNVSIFELDEIQNFTLNNTEETKTITGKQGTVLNTTKANKGINGSGTNGLLSGGLMSVQTGSKEVSTDIIIKHYDDGEVTTADKFTLSKTPVGTTGAEVPTLVVYDSATGKATQYVQGTTAEGNKYSVSGKDITFPTGTVKVGDTVHAWYEAKVTDGKGTMLVNNGDSFSEEVELVIIGMAKNACGKEAMFQLIIPRADFVGNWSLEFGDNQTTHKFEFTGLKNACSKNKDFWKFFIYDEADVA